MKLGILIYSIFMLVTSYSFCAAVCESGWQEYSGYCYYVSSRVAKWRQANEECKNMGAELTSIHNSDEHAFILQLLSRSAYYWIGFRLVCHLDVIMYCLREWTDHSSSSYIDTHVTKYSRSGQCWLINAAHKLDTFDCTETYDYKLKEYPFRIISYPIYYICKKEAEVISVPEVTSTEKASHGEISSLVAIQTTTTTEISPTTSSAKRDIITPVVGAVAVIIFIIGIIVVIVCFKRRKNAPQNPHQQEQQEQQQQQQQQRQKLAELNLSNLPPAIPSAPPLESLSDGRTESVVVQGSVLDQEHSGHETALSRNAPNINMNDEHVYTALIKTSGSAQPDGMDNPVYDSREGALAGGAQHPVMKEVKRDATEFDNPNYDTLSNDWTQ